MDTLVEVHCGDRFLGASRSLSVPIVGDMLRIDNNKESNGDYVVEARKWVNGFAVLKVYVKCTLRSFSNG